MADDGDELGLRPLDLHLVGDVAVQHDVAHERFSGVAHRRHDALVDGAPWERELDAIPERGVQR